MCMFLFSFDYLISFFHLSLSLFTSRDLTCLPRSPHQRLRKRPSSLHNPAKHARTHRTRRHARRASRRYPSHVQHCFRSCGKTAEGGLRRWKGAAVMTRSRRMGQLYVRVLRATIYPSILHVLGHERELKRQQLVPFEPWVVLTLQLPSISIIMNSSMSSSFQAPYPTPHPLKTPAGSSNGSSLFSTLLMLMLIPNTNPPHPHYHHHPSPPHQTHRNSTAPAATAQQACSICAAAVRESSKTHRLRWARSGSRAGVKKMNKAR